MVRTPYIDENGLKKGAWSVEEDDKLRAYVQRYGHWNWREIPKFAGLARCGKSCRLRWLNYLRPNVKLGSYTKEEEDLIIKLHLQLGNRWSKIAANLPGRTDNEIKNYWHTHLKKRVRQQPSTLTSKPRKRIGKKIQIKDNYDLKDNNVLILESYPYSSSPLQPQQSNHINNSENSSSIPSSSSSSSSLSSSSSSDHDHDQENITLCSWDFNDELLDGSFWNQPFFTEDCYEQDDCYDNSNNNNVDFDFDFSLFDQSLCSPFWDSLDFSCSSLMDV